MQYPRHAPLFSELNEAERNELWASLALRHTEGLGQRSHAKLMQHFGSAFHAVQAAPHWSDTTIANTKAQMVADGVWRERAHKEWKALSKSDAGILLWTSPYYPVLLRHIYDPPILLYTKGDISLLSNATISIVGSRLCSNEGLQKASLIAAELSRVGITVVSGMAKGVDGTAHKAALKGVGRSIGVLGTGLDICYPRENKKLYKDFQSDGLLITEFPLGMQAMPQNFPARNRIVSGLSLGVLIVEAAARSGSLITARLALEQNREVYAVQGPLSMQNYSGCHELIRQGAHPVLNAEDILRDLAKPLQHQLENAPCLNLMRTRRRKAKKEEPCKKVHAPLKEAQSAKAKHKVHVEKDEHKKSEQRAIPCHGSGLKAKDEQNLGTKTHLESEVKTKPNTAPDKELTTQSKVDSVEDALLAYLANGQEVHIDTISEALGLSAGKASSMLLVLEMTGQVRRLGGMRYMLAKGASCG